ncbi:MAG: DUF2802 domain-containing protein [Spongiibacteraceae bacterium]
MDNFNQWIFSLLETYSVWIGQASAPSVLGITLSFLGLGLLLFSLHSYRRNGGSQQSVADTVDQNEKFWQKISAQESLIGILSERITALEGYIDVISERQQKLENAKNDARFYQHAIRLADQGMEAAELAECCSISASEAELITELYQKTA